jgi:uncharacterized protein (TIGR02996 family)
MKALDTPEETMPQLLQFATSSGGVRRNALVEEQLAALAGLPDDPRISLRLTEIACQFGASPERRQYWKIIFETVARTRDARTFDPLRKHFKDFTGKYFDHHRQAARIVGNMAMNPASAFSSWPLVLGREDAKELSAVEAALSKLEEKADRTELRLLADIAEDWDDDAPRLVYADWLSDRGHPRGELIVLACKKDRTAAADKRLAEITELPFVYGALGDLGEAREVTGGIPKAVELGSFVGMLTWRAAAGYPLLSVVETIELEDDEIESVDDVARLVLHPDCQRLRRLANAAGATKLGAALPGWKVKGDDLVRVKD